MCTAILIGWDPATPPPPHLCSYTMALLVSQDIETTSLSDFLLTWQFPLPGSLSVWTSPQCRYSSFPPWSAAGFWPPRTCKSVIFWWSQIYRKSGYFYTNRRARTYISTCSSTIQLSVIHSEPLPIWPAQIGARIVANIIVCWPLIEVFFTLKICDFSHPMIKSYCK